MTLDQVLVLQTTNTQSPLGGSVERTLKFSFCLLVHPGATPGRKDEPLEVLVLLKELVMFQ